MGLNHCRWIYKHGDITFRYGRGHQRKLRRSTLDFRVISGEKVKLLITHHFDELNGWSITPADTTGEYVVRPAGGSMITGKFPHAQFRIKINSSESGFKACGDEVLYLIIRITGTLCLSLM